MPHAGSWAGRRAFFRLTPARRPENTGPEKPKAPHEAGLSKLGAQSGPAGTLDEHHFPAKPAGRT